VRVGIYLINLILIFSFGIKAYAAPKVLTSIKPLQLIAAAIQDGISTPQNLLPAGASVHSYSLRPSDLQAINEADLLYWIGEDLESFLSKAISNRAKKSVALQHLPDMNLRYFTNLSLSNEQDAAHQNGMLDAHLWLSIANAKVIARQMTQDLSKIDPLNNDIYQANLAKFTAQMDDLPKQIQTKLQNVKKQPFFVFHATFNYFIADFELQQKGVLSLASGVNIGAKHLAALKARLHQSKTKCVFYEPPSPPKLGQTLTADLPLKLAQLDALGSAIELNASGYADLLLSLADDLRTCLE